MTDKKMQNNKISNINISELKSSQYTYINKTGYCSKCLRELDEGFVKDMEGNLFCDSECRREYYYENKRELDNMLKEFVLGGRR